MYYVFVALILFLAAALDDLVDGRVHDGWVLALVLHVIIFGDVGVLQVWFGAMFSLFGYYLVVAGVWSMGDLLLFVAGSLYLGGFGMVVVYLFVVVVVGAVYSFAWDEILQVEHSVRFVPVLAVAFAVSQAGILV